MPQKRSDEPSYVDPESGNLVEALDTATALRVVEQLPCLVHLLPHFRVAAINKAAGGGDMHLYGSHPDGDATAAHNGLVLYR